MTEQVKDRRQFQRFDLSDPISGHFGAVEVSVLDIGILGSLIEHDAALQMSQTGRLAFAWNDHQIELETEVVYTSPTPYADPDKPPRTGKKRHSGLRFLSAIGESDSNLRTLISSCAKQALGDSDAGVLEIAGPDLAAPAINRPPVEAVSPGFKTYRLSRSGWKKTSSDHATQPVDGFTVAATETEDHVSLLCKTFEAASEAGRRSIRALAEVSVSQARQLPPRA